MPGSRCARARRQHFIRKGNHILLARVLAGVVGIPLLVVVLFAGDGLLFAAVACSVGLIGVQEMYRGVAGHTPARPVGWVGWLGVAMAFAAARCWAVGAPTWWVTPVFTGLLMVALVSQLSPSRRAPVRDLGPTVLGAVYVGALLPYLVLLRGTDSPAAAGIFHWHSAGARAVLFAFVVAWAGDTAAYFVGRGLGKHKLCPTLSPGKTVEGLVGGMVAAAAAGELTGPWLLRLVASYPVSSGLALHGLLLGVAAGLLGPAGDLCKSAMKRELGIKDFGGLIPGHGGVLDRFDSVMFVSPAVFYYCAYVLGTR